MLVYLLFLAEPPEHKRTLTCIEAASDLRISDRRECVCLHLEFSENVKSCGETRSFAEQQHPRVSVATLHADELLFESGE